MVSGALLVPALSLPRALLAITAGSLLGTVPLALVGRVGAREGVPGMVLFRPLLGMRGSFLPSVANVVQLIGWTAFEFWAMGTIANAVSRDVLGVDAQWAWTAIVAAACTGLAVAGPIFAVRRWLERFGVWVVVASAVWISIRLVMVSDLGDLWARPGRGGLPFWLAVDLVIAMPVSWLPLVADYTRFARSERGSFASTFWSYAAGNAWFYALGALLVLAAGAGPTVFDIGTSIAATAGGGVVLLSLLAGETDQAMANIYSSAVSVQNVRPELSQRRLVVAVGVAGLGAALAISRDAAGAFESFLFLIGSVFVPLFAVFLAQEALRRLRVDGAVAPGIRWRALVPWIAGFVVYQWCAPTQLGWWTSALERGFSALGAPFPLVAGSALGASAPAFAVAFVLGLAVLGRERR
jgi:putative hydroxymethylpyrimidine transporter CytX